MSCKCVAVLMLNFHRLQEELDTWRPLSTLKFRVWEGNSYESTYFCIIALCAEK